MLVAGLGLVGRYTSRFGSSRNTVLLSLNCLRLSQPSEPASYDCALGDRWAGRGLKNERMRQWQGRERLFQCQLNRKAFSFADSCASRPVKQTAIAQRLPHSPGGGGRGCVRESGVPWSPARRSTACSSYRFCAPRIALVLLCYCCYSSDSTLFTPVGGGGGRCRAPVAC